MPENIDATGKTEGREEGDGFGARGVRTGLREELVGFIEGGLQRGHGLGVEGGE